MIERKGLTRTQASRILVLRQKTGDDAPSKGTHTGGGRHVPMPVDWDGAGRVPPGWSGVHGVFEEEAREESTDKDGVKVITYRKLGTYSVGLPEDIEARITRARLSAMPEEEKTELLAEVTKAREAIAEAEPVEVKPVREVLTR